MKRKSFAYRFLVIALVLCMFSGLASTALAEEADYISYGEDCKSFAKDAAISTIYIDQDKINSDEARNSATCEVLINEDEDYAGAFVKDISAEGGAITNIVAFDTSVYNLEKSRTYDFEGELFRFTFEGVAIANGRPADVVITYSDLHLVVSRDITDGLLELACGNVIRSGHEPNDCYYGFHLDMNIQVLQDGKPIEGTFYFTIVDIDVKRGPNGPFGKNLIDAADNNNYSEQIYVHKGFVGKLYLPDQDGVDDVEENDPKGYKCIITEDEAGVLFSPSVSDRANDANGSFYSGFLSVVNNVHGIDLTVWNSGGSNMQMKTFLLVGVDLDNQPIWPRVTSSTGRGGNIQTTAAGNPNGDLSDESNVLDPGTVTVPNGKAVTYKMTPRKGYRLEKVTVDGVDVEPEKVIAENGSVYYVYTINVENEDHEIEVSWKRIPSSPTPRPEPIPTPEPDPTPTPTPVPAPLNGDDHFAYIIGYPDGNVHPEATITRAEVATIFFRLLKDEVRDANWSETNSFSDVSSGMWFNNAVSTMAKMGVVTGYPDGTFKPNENITRAEFAAIAARFDENANSTNADFSDISGHWAAVEIAKAAANGWVNGYPDGTFKPDQKITRAEAMALVNRVLNRDPEDPSDLLDNMIKWPDNMDTDKWYYLDVQEATNSHTYERTTKITEKWLTIEQPRDWAALER